MKPTPHAPWVLMCMLVGALTVACRPTLTRMPICPPETTLRSQKTAGPGDAKDGAGIVKQDEPGQETFCENAARKRHGTWMLWSPDGRRPLMRREYREGWKNGPAIGWFENGRVHARGVYENDVRQGTWVFYFESGRKQFEGAFRGGVAEGPNVVYWPNGRKRAEGSMRGGKRHGPWQEWQESGASAGTTEYDDGRAATPPAP